ncbi:MAG: Nucleolar protein 16 [Thelocarpon superellum]|nr:MAG: Nucleolar protein 16 [Thelocarpon superellum]
MGRELQKKKNRSSINKVRQKPKSKKVIVRGSAVVASNWSQSQTLSQNYRRLGLTPHLKGSTGGIEQTSATKESSSAGDPLKIPAATSRTLVPTTVRVERASDGSILRVIHPPATGKANPLNDPLAELSSDGEMEMTTHASSGAQGRAGGKARTAVVAALEEQAKRSVPKRPRQLSQREQEWVQRLVDKYGDDHARMVRDRALNPMQQTEADIRRRIKRWRETASATGST